MGIRVVEKVWFEKSKPLPSNQANLAKYDRRMGAWGILRKVAVDRRFWIAHAPSSRLLVGDD